MSRIIKMQTVYHTYPGMSGAVGKHQDTTSSTHSTILGGTRRCVSKQRDIVGRRVVCVFASLLIRSFTRNQLRQNKQYWISRIL